MMVTVRRRPKLKLSLKPDPVATDPELDDATNPLARQRRYVASHPGKGAAFGLVFADAFIRGMREIGYKNPAWALAELIDNSFQAGAATVDIRFKDADIKLDRSKPSQIAVVDNGIGMISKMISHAVRWGGTDRENDREGFGRYGYGLPSAAISLARKYTVYSKTAGKKWYSVHVDLEALSAVAGDAEKIEELLEAEIAELPDWLSEDEGPRSVNDLESGTIVILEDPDRLHSMAGWIAAKTLQMKLLQHFGVIYRHSLNDKRVYVAGERTQIIDPLFLIPDARYVDETEVVAKKVATAAFEMEGSQGKGVVRIRASVLPPNFQNADPASFGKGAKLARRHGIMKDYNGILVCRAGRQIDVVSPDWTKFQNYDLNIKVEIDFDPTLDEFFGLTTSKQQIVIDERMWEKLKQSGKNSGGLQALVKEMRQDLARMRSALGEKRPSDQDAGPRPSAAAMQAAQKFKTRSSIMSPQKTAAAEKALGDYAKEIAHTKDIPLDEAAAAAKRETEKRPFDIEFAAREEAPLYQARRLGLQKRLIINTAHPFYQKVYQRAGEAQAGLEVLLFVLADAELDADGDREAFYRAERSFWSEGLRHALDELESDQALADRTSADAEAD
jgi:hypothetical protein